MSVGILVKGAELHKAFKIKCVTSVQTIDTSTFGQSSTTEVGRSTTCTMETETSPQRIAIYELRCQDSEGCKRFQVLDVRPTGNRFSVSGACLSDEDF